MSWKGPAKGHPVYLQQLHSTLQIHTIFTPLTPSHVLASTPRSCSSSDASKTPNNLNLNNHISFSSSSTSATSTISLRQYLSRSSTTHHFYFNRVVLLWNALPMLDLSQSCSSFKKYIFDILWNHFFTNFDPDLYSYSHFHLYYVTKSIHQQLIVVKQKHEIE